MFSQDTSAESTQCPLARCRQELAATRARLALLEAEQHDGPVACDSSNETCQTIINNLPAGIALIDGTTLRAKWANPAYCRLLDEPYRTLGDIIGVRVQGFRPAVPKRAGCSSPWQGSGHQADAHRYRIRTSRG